MDHSSFVFFSLLLFVSLHFCSIMTRHILQATVDVTMTTKTMMMIMVWWWFGFSVRFVVDHDIILLFRVVVMMMILVVFVQVGTFHFACEPWSFYYLPSLLFSTWASSTATTIMSSCIPLCYTTYTIKTSFSTYSQLTHSDMNVCKERNTDITASL